ncbi:MAG TPA: L-type lectin-domain containing protein [Bryobacteraceae bacterium]|nr:L-type lectin-domain containing protein [Bryobacteraceae bacterium]
MPTGPAEFRFDDFSNLRGLSLVGDAKRSRKVLRIAPAYENQRGGVWFAEKLFVTKGFETTFDFRLTSQDDEGFSGADGLAFVVQAAGQSAIGGTGGAGGFATNNEAAAIPRSLAIFFDTYKNVEFGDPSGNFIAITVNGDGYWPNRRLASAANLPVDLKNRKTHHVRILYSPPNLSVFLNRNPAPVVTATIDLANVVGPEGRGYAGFTAATGGGYQNHDLLRWSFGPAPKVDPDTSVSASIRFLNHACLPNRTLCTPEQPTVEEKGAGRYRIVLPAHLEWGVSVPNPTAASVRILSAAGTICWEPSGRAAPACNGPAGSDIQGAGEGFVSPAAAAGSLVFLNRDGKTFFSVNDRSSRGFQDNEGFFDFDVQIGGR